MKIFYKKDYLRVSGELEEANSTLSFYRTYTEELDCDKNELKKKLKIANGSLGGFTKEINKLKSEIASKELKIKDLEDKLKESMSNKYILRKIKPGRTPNTIKTSIRSSASESNAIKYVKERL